MTTDRDQRPPEATSTAGASGKPIVRAELIIATLALVASACASVAAIVQTREAAVQTQATLEQNHIVAKQLGASVWPYLTIDESFSRSPRKLALTITNQGLGPALIRAFTIAVDGRARTRSRDVFDVIDPNDRARTVDDSDFGGGSVLRPAESLTLFSLYNKTLNLSTAQTRLLTRVELEACYCSLLEECWSVDSKQTVPRMVHTCGPPTKPLAL